MNSILRNGSIALVTIVAAGTLQAQSAKTGNRDGDSRENPLTIANSLKQESDRHNAAVGADRGNLEGFEGTFLPTCWTSIDADGDGQNWFLYNAANSPFEGLNSAASASWTNATGPLTPDNYLVSPQLELGDSPVLTYQVGAQDPAWPAEQYGVYVSTTGNAAADFTQVFVETLVDGAWHERTVDLSAYANQTVYISWRHFGVTDNFYMKLDAIVLPGTPLACFDCSSVTYPTVSGDGVTCSDVAEGWTYNIEISDAAGGGFTLTNSAGLPAQPITAAGTYSVGPLTNGQAVNFAIVYDVEPTCFIGASIAGDCTYPCAEVAAGFGPWTDLNTAGIPVPDANGVCGTLEFQDYETWVGEGYALDLPANASYTFSICEGPGAGSVDVVFTVLDPQGNIIASESNLDGCSITWNTTDAGSYTLIITQVGYCGIGFQINNGYPYLICNGFASGVSELNKVEASVYPNPAFNVLNIESDLNGEGNLTIFDVTGRLVNAQRIVLNNRLITKDISDLASGIYVIQVTVGENIISERFVKQ